MKYFKNLCLVCILPDIKAMSLVFKYYIPDGKGVTYNYEPTIPGNSYALDDDLVLWFTKALS